MNATFEQKYDQTFLNTAKAFYINTSAAYTPLLSIICAVSIIPQFFTKGVTTQQMISLICIIICGALTFILQQARADQLFKYVDTANDNVKCTVDIKDNHIDYRLHTDINDLKTYHLDFSEIKELLIGNKQGIIVLDDITILPFGITPPGDTKEEKKERNKLMAQIRKSAPQNVTTMLYKIFRLVLIIFTVVNIMAIFG